MRRKRTRRDCIPFWLLWVLLLHLTWPDPPTVFDPNDVTRRTAEQPTVDISPPHVNHAANTTLDFFASSPNVFYTSADGALDWQGKHCQKLNPQFQFQVYDNAACREFIQENYPEFVDLYNHWLPLDIMRADMWRYLILHKYGGIYLDVDVECIVPFEEWLPRLNLKSTKGVQAIVGLEFRDPDPPVVQFTQWAMASRQPGHPLFYRTVEIIQETVQKKQQEGSTLTVEDTEYVTGPKVFTRAVVEYLIQQGRFQGHQVEIFSNNVLHVDDATLTTDIDEVVGELALLHKNAFGHHFMHPRAKGDVFVRHHFAGSWRQPILEDETKKLLQSFAKGGRRPQDAIRATALRRVH